MMNLGQKALASYHFRSPAKESISANDGSRLAHVSVVELQLDVL